MTRKGLVKAINNFVKNNEDLINEFNQGGENFEYYIPAIVDIIGLYLCIYRFPNIQDILSTAIMESLNGTNFVQAVEDIMKNYHFDEYDGSLNMYYRDLGRNYKMSHDEKTQMILDNTKMVISEAHKYTGLGLSLEELISAGNLGLLTAYEKYDPKKMALKDNMLEVLETGQPEDLLKHITYGAMHDKLVKFLEQPRSVEEAREWVEKNIKNAKFSSVCMVWIRSHILMEIDAYSRVVKKPKQDIYKDRSESGGYIKEITKDIFDVKGTDGTVFGDTVCGGSTENDFEVVDAYNGFKETLIKLFEGLPSRSRNIVLKKFGLGLPRALTPKEIGEQEGLTVARVSQIFAQAMEVMRNNAKKHNVDVGELYELVEMFK